MVEENIFRYFLVGGGENKKNKGPWDLRKYKSSEWILENWPTVNVLDFVKDVWNVENSDLDKKIWAFFVNVFWCNISSGNYFRKHAIYYLIYMIIHVKRQLSQINVKSVENISRKNKNYKTCATKALFFCSFSEISTFQTYVIKSKT